MQQKTRETRQAYLSEQAETSTWAKIKLVVGLIALGALILFLVQNFQGAKVNFLWFTWHTQVIWALLAAAIAGAIATIVFGTLQARNAKARTKVK
jgi:uncharacterized integral membrane protein